ncbi:kinase [Asticcacaulis solisilvae]|uniref:kinase n=1 Tax=Asticcacaulis solisilvae TaxID=1217274 RepID=UPI003FD81501
MSRALDVTSAAVDGWLAGSRRPLVVGICGAQGSGKSTLARHLCERAEARGGRVALLSIDDLYLSRKARAQLAVDVHPLFATRGVPGTHDVGLGLSVLDGLRAGATVHLPRFDKGTDDPVARSDWPAVEKPVDIVLFEGWCVGARPEPDAALAMPINDLERDHDPDGRWRRAVNAALGDAYSALFARLDRLVFLAAPAFEVVRDWRTQQEHGLKHRLKREGRHGSHVMSDAEVGRFVQYYERLTRHILASMPACADLTLRLDSSRKLIG